MNGIHCDELLWIFFQKIYCCFAPPFTQSLSSLFLAMRKIPQWPLVFFFSPVVFTARSWCHFLVVFSSVCDHRPIVRITSPSLLLIHHESPLVNKQWVKQHSDRWTDIKVFSVAHFFEVLKKQPKITFDVCFVIFWTFSDMCLTEPLWIKPVPHTIMHHQTFYPYNRRITWVH